MIRRPPRSTRTDTLFPYTTRFRSNLGPAGARNAGLAKVSTPLVAFVDSDVTVTPDALLSLAKHFTDPKVALVGPRIIGTVHTDHPRWFERYDAARSSLTLGSVPGSVRPGAAVGRSEEHTSELQSLMRNSYAVFCLKKKTHTKATHKTYDTQ